MPPDRAQSKALNGASPHSSHLAKFRGIANDGGPPRRLILMPTRRTVILAAAILVAAFGAASAPLALCPRASAADASALAFVSEIYNAYKARMPKATRSTTNAPSGATSSHRSRR
jgi:hypothetical protein